MSRLATPRLSIVGARVVDPLTDTDRVVDLHLADGRIAAIGAAPEGFAADRRIDAKGLVATAGLIDLSAHLREPGNEYRASLESEMRAAVAGGVTSLVCPPDTDPALDEPGLVEMLKHRARGLALARLYPLGALTLGLAGERIVEMAELTEAGCVGFSQAHSPVVDTQVLLRAMQYAATFGFTVWLHPLDPHLGRGGVAHSGPVATRLGLPSVPVISETVALHTIFELVRTSGCRVHLCRLSSAAGIELVRAARREGLPITCDVAVHHLHLTDVDIGWFDGLHRVDPPFRGQRDRDAIRAGLRDGTVDAICSDHTPVDDDAKHLPFGEAEPGVSGLELLLPLALGWAAQEGIALSRVIDLLTRAPAAIIGPSRAAALPGTVPSADTARADGLAGPAGSGADFAGVAVGAAADLCLFDPDEPWVVDRGSLCSQGRNTPYLGRELVGRVRATVVAGRLVHERA
ncbi:MAG: dihydroorotase [Lautropia sp.]